MADFSYRIGQADVAALRWRGREVVRRLFVTVRDKHWLEVPPSEWRVEGEGDLRTFRARHTSDLVDFEWEGILEAGTEGGRLSFSFEGRALRDMEICRLGLVALYPVAPLIGRNVEAVGPAGREVVAVSPHLHPQPLVQGVPGSMLEPFSELALAWPGVGHVTLRFGGDLFELEDQRNWGDASFKSYCTPLRLGFPRTIAAGTVIQHSVTITIEPSAEAAPVPAKRKSIGRSRQADAGRFPTLGRMAPPAALVTDSRWAQGWHHVRFDLEGWQEPTILKNALQSLPKATRIELCLSLDAESSLTPSLLDLLEKHHERISAVLVRASGSPLPTRQALEDLRSLLNSRLPHAVPLAVLPNGYFVEFNREVPFELPVDGIAFPLSATVHSDDAGTIADNVVAVADMVRTARQLTGKSSIAVSPLALYHPSAAPSRFPATLVTPWLVATLAHAAAAGVESVTLANDVVEAMSATSEGQQVLEQLAMLGGRQVGALESAADGRVHVLTLQCAGDGVDVLIANLSEESVELQSEEHGEAFRIKARAVCMTSRSAERRDGIRVGR